MREKKRSLRHFKYRECDAFAKFLEQQAERGWHFKEWRAGLVFEKGEPRKAIYSVEVFPKGDERDSRPEKDAEEFAEYCRAAGWELVDGKRKFCIFKAKRKDAVPIATPKERYENICKAEKEWLYMPLVNLFMSLIILAVVWNGFYKFVFWNSALFIGAVYFLIVIFSVVDALAVLLWRRKKKRQIENGETVFYGKTIGVRYLWLVGVLIAGAIIIRLDEMGTYDIGDVLIVSMPYASSIILGILALIAVIFRPSAKRWTQLYWILLLMVLFGCGGLGIYYSMKAEPEAVSEVYAPLMQEDFKEVSGERYISGKQSETFLGKRYDYYIGYGNSETDSDQMTYEAYTSKYNWVIEHLWNTRKDWGGIYWRSTAENGSEVIEGTVTDCKELWGAEEAWLSRPENYNEKYCYEVRFPEAVMVLRTKEQLDEEDVQIIRDKVELK